MKKRIPLGAIITGLTFMFAASTSYSMQMPPPPPPKQTTGGVSMITLGKNLRFMVANGLIKIENPSCNVDAILKALTTGNGIPNCVGMGEDIDLSENPMIGSSNQSPTLSPEESKKKKLESLRGRGGKQMVDVENQELIEKLKKRREALEKLN
jgi:hypothetical protein